MFCCGTVAQFCNAWGKKNRQPKARVLQRDILIGWTKLESGSVKMNSNKTSKGNPYLAGDGRCIRDYSGVWLIGFAMNVGINTSMKAEVWALL